MSKCTLTVNGTALLVNYGETLTNAAMRHRVVIPQDCCSGQCDTCRVQVHSGAIDDFGTSRGKSVQACMARVEGDAVISFEAVPNVVKRRGEIISIRPLSREIDEVLVELPQNFNYLPGQYVSLKFEGFPARDYSPTAFEDGTYNPRILVLHIKKYKGGLVSSQIGEKITIGSKVKIKGPHGHAFYRAGNERMVLVASGTGWAPIWSVAREAILLNPSREIIIVAGARDGHNLYMKNSTEWLKKMGVINLTLSASGSGYSGGIKKGRPTHFMPSLLENDLVYAAGVPAMVEAVTKLAMHAGATIYADPFTINQNGLSLFNRLQQIMLSPRQKGATMVLSPRPSETATYQLQTTHMRAENKLIPPLQRPRTQEEKRKAANI